MKTAYFTNCSTVATTKKLYRELCFKFHPDFHQDEVERYTEIMKQVNAQYQKALAKFDGETFVGSDKKNHTYYYNQDIEEELAAMLQKLVGLRMVDVTIELIGTWIWVSGDTKPWKEQLKALKLRWHSKRRRWYFRKAQYKRRYSNAKFSELRTMYGATEYESDKLEAIKG